MRIVELKRGNNEGPVMTIVAKISAEDVLEDGNGGTLKPQVANDILRYMTDAWRGKARLRRNGPRRFARD